jgi:hypothetical protein
MKPVGGTNVNVNVIENGKFIKLVKGRTLHPRADWWAVRYKGQFWPVFWNAVGHECIDISDPEWLGVSSKGIKEWKDYPYYAAHGYRR